MYTYSDTNPPHFEGDLAPIFDFDVGTARPDILFNADRIQVKLHKIMRIYMYADPYPDTHIYFQFLLIFSSFLSVDILISLKIIVP